MKKITLLFAILFASISYAQEKKGYYINNNNEKVEGYIRSAAILNPATVSFKPLSGGDFAALNLNNVTEYGIDNEVKLQKHTVDVDMTGGNQVAGSKESVWNKMDIFLNVITEGDATLYSYTMNNVVRYFYSVKSKDIAPKQLIYKKFQESSGPVKENHSFRQQLYADLKCEGQTDRSFLKVNYYQDELTDVVKKFNACNSSGTSTDAGTSKTFAKNEEKKVAIKFTLYAGADFTNIKVSTDQSNLTSTEENTTSPGIGAELALRILKGDYEFFTRFEYEKLKATVENTYSFSSYNTVTETHMLEADVLNFYLGARKNFAIGAQNKIFVDAALCISNPIGDWEMYRKAYNAGGNYVMSGRIDGLRTSFSVNFGVGYVFNDKYGIAVRYDTNRNMFGGISTSDETKISKLSLNLRYTIN